ncbi:MAG: hypothetical protein HY660_11735 [Armatimonadetes bacterium]|nr:hypothetical protein [Armatimonadota bacterium]
MATLRAAETARRRMAEVLRRAGAHAIEVAQVTRGGRKVYAVIAHFTKRPRRPLPKVIEVRSGPKTLRVPLVVRITERFRPEVPP